MTSQKSSISTFSFTFWSALKGNFILPLINLIAITFAVPVSCFYTIKQFSGENYDPRTGMKIDEVRKIADYYKYLIFSDEYDGITGNVLLHLSVIVFSILLGVMLFRFIANKKTVNVFYSLGITRKNLFLSKYLAGLIMLAASIIIPFAVCLLINISKFGSSPELWSAILYHILGYCALSFTAFSLTAAVFSGVGTVVEGITFSGILMLGPTVAIYSLQFLMNKLVLGSPYGHFYDSAYQVTNSLATKLSRFNPLLFLFNHVTVIGALARDNPKDKFIWVAPVYTDVILWFAVATGLFLLGITVFQKRKAEICGFIGANRWLNFAVTFLIGFFPLSIAISSPLSTVVAVLIGLAIFIVLYSIIDFALIRNLKEWTKGLYKLPIHLGISLLIIVVFATGLFGFSTRMPKNDDIKSAEIAPVTYSGLINPYASYNGDENFLYSAGQSELVDDFRTADDLKTIIELHKILMEAGRLPATQGNVDIPVPQLIKRPDIRISYQLKNGKTFNRYYNAVSVANLTAFLALDKTDRYDEIIMQNLTQPITDKDSKKVVSNKTVFQEDTSIIEIIPNTLNVANPLELSAENRKLLLAAIAKDLIGQTVEERFFPKTPSMGAIRFSAGGDKGTEEFEEFGIKDSMATEMIGLVEYASASIVITPDMKNTLAFLKDNDLMSLFDKQQNIDFVGARVLPAVLPDNGPYSYYGSAAPLHFMGGWSKAAFDYGSFGGTYQVTDKTLVDEIAANAHIAYYNSAPGYFVRLEMKDKGGYTTMYVPAEKMPKSVADAVARHEIVPPDFQGYMY